jgi:hypothetical protein
MVIKLCCYQLIIFICKIILICILLLKIDYSQSALEARNGGCLSVFLYSVLPDMQDYGGLKDCVPVIFVCMFSLISECNYRMLMYLIWDCMVEIVQKVHCEWLLLAVAFDCCWWWIPHSVTLNFCLH